MQAMIRHPPAGATSLPENLGQMVRNIKRRSLVVVISDLIDEPQDTMRAIRLFATHRHDVVVFHLHDAAEQEFDFQGPTLFSDMETGEELEVDPAAVRQAYLERLGDLQAYYRKGLTELGIDYEVLDTRRPYDEALSAYLRRRARMSK